MIIILLSQLFLPMLHTLTARVIPCLYPGTSYLIILDINKFDTSHDHSGLQRLVHSYTAGFQHLDLPIHLHELTAGFSDWPTPTRQVFSTWICLHFYTNWQWVSATGPSLHGRFSAPGPVYIYTDSYLLYPDYFNSELDSKDCSLSG